MKNKKVASASNNEAEWFQLTVDESFKYLSTISSGLTTSEAKTRLEKYL